MSALIYVHSSAYVSWTRMYADIRRANMRGYSAADTQTCAMVCARVPASLPLCMCLDSQVTQDAVTWKLNLNLSATFPSCNPLAPHTTHPAQPGNSKSSSLRLPCLPPSQSLWTFIGERPVGPFGCLQSRDRPVDCCAHVRLESSPTAAAAWSDTKVAKRPYTCRSTYTHTANMSASEPPPLAKCDLKSPNGKWQCYQCADHQTI